MSLRFLFGERVVPYEFHECEELVLAYAITIHKSQGSEYGAVIIPLFTQHFTLLQRSLIYTAITRAKKVCVIVGQPRAVAFGVRTVNSLGSAPFLQEFLTGTLVRHQYDLPFYCRSERNVFLYAYYAEIVILGSAAK